MSVDLTFGMAAVLIGGGATLFMDLWAALQNRLLGVPSLNYALVGRWIGHRSPPHGSPGRRHATRACRTSQDDRLRGGCHAPGRGFVARICWPPWRVCPETVLRSVGAASAAECASK